MRPTRIILVALLASVVLAFCAFFIKSLVAEYNEQNTVELDKVVWSPDGRYIAFNVWSRYSLTGLYILQRDENRVYRMVDHHVSNLVWSPDSRKVMFTALLDEGQSIYIADINSSHVQPFFSSSNSNDAVSAWSPNGEWIAFTSNRESSRRLYLSDRNGQDIHSVSNYATAQSVSWSPSSSRLAYIALHGSEDTSVRVMSVDTEVEELIIDRSARHSAVAWSSNECDIAFSNLEGIHLYDVCTSSSTLVTPLRADQIVWSKDNTYLAIINTSGVFVVNVGSGNYTPVYSSFYTGVFWSLDGRELEYLVLPNSFFSTEWSVERYSLASEALASFSRSLVDDQVIHGG